MLGDLNDTISRMFFLSKENPRNKSFIKVNAAYDPKKKLETNPSSRLILHMVQFHRKALLLKTRENTNITKSCTLKCSHIFFD